MWMQLLGAALALWLAGSAWLAWYCMMVPGRTHSGSLPALTAEEIELASRLEGHIRAIASTPHNVTHYANLEAAARYLERTLEGLGYGVERQVFEADGRTVRNIAVVLPPAIESAEAATLVIGAHYDSCHDAPGANDNGTGVAALLELARLLRGMAAPKTRVRLVLFVNEEPPYFATESMGSWRYAKRLAEQRETVRGMISLETLGYFSDEPNSQHYPQPISLFFPSTANFITFTATLESRAFLHEAIGSFRRHTAFPTIGGVGPRFIKGLDWSDHRSFARHGFPAIMITDTALYRYVHYHQTTDTPDKVDTAKLARITKGIERVVRDLAQ